GADYCAALTLGLLRARLLKERAGAVRTMRRCGQEIRGPSAIVDSPNQALAIEVKLLHFGQVERTRTKPAEYGDLITGLVHCTVAIQSLGKRQGRGGCLTPRDQFRFRVG